LTELQRKARCNKMPAAAKALKMSFQALKQDTFGVVLRLEK